MSDYNNEERRRALAKALSEGPESVNNPELARFLGLGGGNASPSFADISSAYQLALQNARDVETQSLRSERDKLRQQVQSLANDLAKERAASTEQGIKLGELSQSLSEAKEALESSAKVISEKGMEISELNGKLESLRRQYDELTILRDAAKFWLDKAEEHKNSFIRGAIGFSVSVILLVVCLFQLWPEILVLLPKSNGEVSLSGVGVLFLLALGPVWVLRIIARFTHENFSLWTDSSARNTMMNTYLALVGNPNAGIQPQDRSIILSAVFRPTLGQSEDGMPASMMEVLTRVIDRRAG